MATNLLLEGPNLEELLARAHAEAGAQAKIVRAEKVRRGGFLGFFARPGFEVALEVPDVVPGDLPADAIADGAQHGGADAEREPVDDAETALLTLAQRVDAAERAAARAMLDSERSAYAAAEELDDLERTEDRESAAVECEPTIQSIQPAPRRRQFVALLDHLRLPGRARHRRPDPVEPMFGDDGTRDDDDIELDSELAAGELAGELESIGEVCRDDVELGDITGDELDQEDDIDQEDDLGVVMIQPVAAARPVPPQRLSAPEFLGTEYETLAVVEIAPHPVASIPLPRPASEPVAERLLDDVAEQVAASVPTGTPVLPTTGRGPSIEDQRAAEEFHAEQRRAQRRLARDRSTLRALGVPRAWTRRMPAGDRFGAVLMVLERVPDAVIDPDAAVVAVVGPPGVVELEAHRTAVDLHAGGLPRPTVILPTRNGEERRTAVSAAGRSRPVVVAIPTEGYDDVVGVRRALKSAKAEVVIAVVDAHRSIEDTTRWIEAIDSVDAVAVDGALEVPDPASVLQLELPVIRLDGIAVDRVGWAAVLCAQLTAGDPVAASPDETGE